MIAHIGIIVSDIERSKKFYAAALAPIGYRMIREYGVTPARPAASAGFGEPPRADLWIYQGDPGTVATHIAFKEPRAQSTRSTTPLWPAAKTTANPDCAAVQANYMAPLSDPMATISKRCARSE
jgi:catechol 2,3-dioxygenase-like lactoylglutathione lyase family enzyme